ncbi:MAG: hypothetical protein ACFFCP_01370 [Promethearchaeota archaeon]
MAGSALRIAFEKVAQHISNLEDMKQLVDEIENKFDSLDSIIKELENAVEGAEATFRTDIRILINECRHLKRQDVG